MNANPLSSRARRPAAPFAPRGPADSRAGGGFGRGMLLMAASSLVFSAMSFLVPFTHSISTSVVTAAGFATGIPVIGGLGVLGVVEIKPVNRLWLVLAGIGILATLAQLLMTRAYRDVPAAEGSLLAFLVPVINSVLGVVVFGERLQPTTMAGALLVLAACAYVALRERIVRIIE